MLNTLELSHFFSISFLNKNKRHKASLVTRPANAKRFWLGAFLLSLNLVIMFSFIAGVNSYAATGYEIKKLQQRSSQLLEDNKKLSVKVSEISSIAQIQNGLANADFVPVAGVRYLQVNQLTQR